MMIFRTVSFMLAAGLCLVSCSETHTTSEQTSTVSDSAVTEPSDRSAQATSSGDTLFAGGIKMYPLSDSPGFNDAILSLNEPMEKASLKKNTVHFNYEIKNYFLSQPTKEGTCASGCANSAQGQHIHLILNNQPYLAKYTTAFDEELTPGRYVALSFLSRSYHESIKHYEAFDLRQFTVGKTEEPEVDLTQPLLFYSRPKGEYKGKDTQKVLLDFYVVNASLGANDYKVRATINGNAFLLTSWKGYLMEGLPMGENKVKIELLDKNDQLVPGPYSTTERSFMLQPEAVN